ncbi:hypothetical protein FRZ61_37340 [Hypericibacter adhaerens]|jgi:hypothetical protein|uniref:Uncharacterized protein n=1 Tax=Hypericibacter adhaerens TaxID=2602016 RepID=A0A5J6N4E6_9PROT|nr:hypothetical protein FRZ61_37340 [Hypericibacter adhaerens]
MMAPSEFNVLAREMLGLQKLRPELFDYPQSARQMLRARLMAGGYGESLKCVRRTVEDALREVVREMSGVAGGDKELEEKGLEGERFAGQTSDFATGFFVHDVSP